MRGAFSMAGLAGWLGLACVSPLLGASLDVEPFDTDAAGWTLSGVFAVLPVTVAHASDATNGWIEISFPATGFPDPVAAGTISTTSSVASAGAFVGDYDAVDGRVLGFSFFAEDALPTALAIRWNGAGEQYGVNVTQFVTNTSEWIHITVSLASAAAGPWNPGDPGSFESALQQVEELEVFVQGGGPFTAATFRVDNIHLSALPQIASVEADAVDEHVMVTGLQPGLSYELVSYDLSSQVGTPVASFVAGAAQEEVIIPSAGSASDTYFLRFVQ